MPTILPENFAPAQDQSCKPRSLVPIISLRPKISLGRRISAVFIAAVIVGAHGNPFVIAAMFSTPAIAAAPIKPKAL